VKTYIIATAALIALLFTDIDEVHIVITEKILKFRDSEELAKSTEATYCG
jgi:hypothetical protein